jgi:hypothetical protein
MGKKWLILAGVGLTVVVLTLALAVPAFAQEATPSTPTTPKGWFGGGRGFGFRGGSWEDFDATAEALGLTPEQLFAELHSGKSLQDIATEKGVDMQKINDALQASRNEAMKAAIEQAVTDGKLTREQADWMLKGLELGMMPGGRGFGRGFGFGGRGGCRGLETAPSTTPSTSSYRF